MKTCYACGGKMEKAVELVISNGKTIPQEIMKCSRCGKATISSDEYERVRKELYLSIFSRINKIFKMNHEIVIC